jgi:hypothetical protein
MPNDSWISVADYTDRVLADAALGLLALERIPCYVASNEFVPGLGSAFSVRVPVELIGQAHVLLDQSPVSDAELTELALKAPPEESQDE